MSKSNKHSLKIHNGSSDNLDLNQNLRSAPDHASLKLISLFMLSFLILLIGVGTLSTLTEESPIITAPSGADDNNKVVNKEKIAKSYGDLPIFFIPNEDQLPKDVKYYSKGAGYSFYLTGDGVTYSFSRKNENKGETATSAYEGYSLKLNFLGRNPKTEIIGSKELDGKVNYFIGDDPSKWKTDIPVYGGAVYKDLYKGIDLVYKGSERIIKYEYKVAPGADYQKIQMSYTGVDSLKLNPAGDLLINTPWGELKDEKPVVYQMVGGKRKSVDGAFTLSGTTVGFTLGSYNKNLPLIIDPGLSYSTYFGGGGSDFANDIDVDKSGNAYITGITSAPGANNLPVTGLAYDFTYNFGEDVFVTKFNPAGNALIYSTYLGGGSDEEGQAIEVDPRGYAYVTGFSRSSDFPHSLGQINGANDAFLTKLDKSGSSLQYSRFIGGTNDDFGNGLAVNRDGEVFVAGNTNSNNFPFTPNAMQTERNNNDQIPFKTDGFLARIDSSGSNILYGTYIGRDDHDDALDVAIDRNNIAYVVGHTKSNNFALTVGSYGQLFTGGGEGFITIIDPKGQGSADNVYSSYIGGSRDEDYVEAVAVDGSGNAYLTGSTNSDNFGATFGSFQEIPKSPLASDNDAFVFKLNPSGNGGLDRVYSTYLSGSASDWAKDIELDNSNNAYVAGYTYSADFPIKPGAFDTTHTVQEAFVTIINSTGSGVLDSTFLGGAGADSALGIGLDIRNNVYVTGKTNSAAFPLNNAYSSSPNDIFVSKFDTSNDPFAGGLPDLSITSITPSDANPDTSETISVDVVVRNNGATLAIPFDVDLHDHAPPSSPPPNGQIGFDYKSVSGLLPNQETTVTFNNISWPQGGYHDLYASVDTLLIVPETSEVNNISGPVNIMVSKPDLVIDSLTVSKTTAENNETVFVDVVVTNQGEVDANAFKLDLYDNPASTPTVGLGGDSSQTIAGLSVGTSTTITFPISWASNSTHTLIAQADTYNAIPEISESNNLSNSAFINVLSQPDLVINNMTVSKLNPGINEPIVIDVVVKNQGSANAAASSLTLYDKPSPVPPLVGQAGAQTQALPILAPGATSTITFITSWSSNGSHNLYAFADSAGIVTEKNETNNISGPANVTVFSTVSVTVPWGPSNWEWSAGKYTTGDFNADGKIDIAVMYGYITQREVTLFVFKGNDVGFDPPAVWWSSGPGNWDWGGSKLTAGDYDGDGDSDVCILYGYQTTRDVRLFVFPSNAIGKPAGDRFKFLASEIWFHAGPGNWDWGGSNLVTGNFNGGSGDNRDDIGILYGYVTQRDVIFFVFPSNGFTFNTSQPWWKAGPGNWDWIGSKLTVGDYNNDNNDDVGILYGYAAERDVRIFVFPSSGTKLKSSQVWFHAGVNNWDWGGSKVLSAEMTGDAFDDMVIFYGYSGGYSSIFVFPSNTVNAFNGSRVWYSLAQHDWNRSFPFAGNFDGTGASEIANFYNNGNSYSQIYLYK